MAKYLDQTGLVTVLTKIKTWVESKGYLTSHQDISGKQDKITSSNKLDYSLINNTPTIPTNNNQLTNGAGYQTASQVSTSISNAIKDITSFEYEVVESLPSTGVKGKIYLLSNSGSNKNAYDEYVWVNSTFEKLGSTDVDLSGYVQDTRKINNKSLSSDVTLTYSDVNAAPSEHTHNYTNDSALQSTDIVSAFTSAGISVS